LQEPPCAAPLAMHGAIPQCPRPASDDFMIYGCAGLDGGSQEERGADRARDGWKRSANSTTCVELGRAIQ
jgi:hypothetical protein